MAHFFSTMNNSTLVHSRASTVDIQRQTFTMNTDKKAEKPQLSSAPASSPTSQALLTPKALALSLSAPRIPPRASKLSRNWNGLQKVRNLLASTSRQTRSKALQPHKSHYTHPNSPHYHESSLYSPRAAHENHIDWHHPHIVADGHLLTRILGVLLPLSLQHSCRDSGGFRAIADGLVTLTAPGMALTQPSLLHRFMHLTRTKQTIKYGQHQRQIVDIWVPQHLYNIDESTQGSITRQSTRRLLVFVHGGAWGSGETWMYRLVADEWVSPDRQTDYAVAIIGYRTYPDGMIIDQVDDCHNAMETTWRFLTEVYKMNKSTPITIMGHSSGAHVALLWLMRYCKTTSEWYGRIDSFIGLAGVYDIAHHFDYEASRGVEEISPLKPVCGSTRTNFRLHSPGWYWPRVMGQEYYESAVKNKTGDTVDASKDSGGGVEQRTDNIESIDNRAFASSSTARFSTELNLSFESLMIHGLDDTTVPFTSTAEIAHQLEACGAIVRQVYLPGLDHTEPVIHLMTRVMKDNSTLRVVKGYLRELDGTSDDGRALDASKSMLPSGKHTGSIRMPMRSKL
jgi:acetyl esterase/lipase